jgi:thioredoxin 1
MENELEKIRKRKLEQLKQHYMIGGTKMETTIPDAPLQITDANINEHVNKYPAMAIDCWAPWCAPCRMVAPVVEQLAKDMKGKMVFGKLNVDENQATSLKYQIMSIPTLLIFRQGQLVDKIIGAMPKDILKSKLEPYL